MSNKKKYGNVPLGLPDQAHDLPTLPLDRGDETQNLFQYQWVIGVILLLEGIKHNQLVSAIWCEHHDDYLVELRSGKFRAIQVKTDSRENAKWKLNNEAFIHSIKRFCQLESIYGQKIDAYEFCSNAPSYVPAANAKLKSKIGSPLRLIDLCCKAKSHELISPDYKNAFDALTNKVCFNPDNVFAVLKKLSFRQGLPLRGYQDALIGGLLAEIPGCMSLAPNRLRLILKELLDLVRNATLLQISGIDGALAYIANNGQAEAAIRGKCITVEAARLIIEQRKHNTFKYVGIGEGLKLGSAHGQKNVLQRKMRNGYVGSQFESIWRQSLAAEQRLLDLALAEPDRFDELLHQIESVVLVECQDAEVMASNESDEKKRGLAILRRIIDRMTQIAACEPEKVEREPKETLMGVAGMLSGECKFAWGVPIEEYNSNGI